jgi:uncharacterized membrane protein YqaE (UPF0057 family)
MNRDEIEKLIDEKIQQHEFRIGIISGVLGALFVFGIIHAIWSIKESI